MSGANWTGIRESYRRRVEIPHPLPLPFLLLPDGSLICPWCKRPVLLWWQEAQLGRPPSEIQREDGDHDQRGGE